MRRLMIPALSALILLCIPFLDPQICGLLSIRHPPLIINLLRGWAPAAKSLRPGAPPAQAPASERSAAQSDQERITLEHGKPIERELSGGQSHSYKLALVSGHYSHIVVEQLGIDVAVTLFTPEGKKIIQKDSELVIEGSETLSTVAEVTGAYLIEVRATEKTAKTGRYAIKIGELRTATVEDKYRVAAESILREAEQLASGTSEAKRQGVEKYHEALELYRKAGDRRGEADTIDNIGKVYWLLGEMQKALGKFNEALPIKRAVGARKGEADTINYIGMVYRSLDEMQKALEKYSEALPIFQSIGDRKGEAMALNNIGTVYYSLGEMQKAIEKYNEALSINRVLSDRDGEAITLNNIGMVYYSFGEMQKAIENLNETLQIRRIVSDRKSEAITLINIGLIHRSLGEMGKALEKYNEALPVVQSIGDRYNEAITINNIGSLYQALGETRKALEKFNEALPIFPSVGSRRGEAATLGNIGQVYLSLGEMRKALEKFSEALLIFQSIGDLNGKAAALANIGVVYRSQGEMRKALEKFNEALPIFQSVGDRSGAAATLSNIGLAYQSLGETQNALEKFNEALPIRREVGDRAGEATTILGIARVEQKRGNLPQARQLIEQAIGVIESVRADIGSPELRASFFATRQGSYESYIDVLIQMHKQNQDASFEALALASSERARARSLLELLTEARADIRQGVDSALLERERSLRRRLAARAAAQSSLLKRKHTPAQAEAAAREIASITDEYDGLQGKIRDSSPKYAALTQPQPLNLSEIQQQVLDPETLLLEYSLGENASYLFLVSQTSISSYQLPKRAEIEAATKRVHELLTATQLRPGETEAKRQARIEEARADYWPRAMALSRMLLGPVDSKLGKKRLVIVADGALQYIPFAALPTPSPGNDKDRSAGADPQPLIVEHEIVSLPSASTLAELRRETAGRKPAEKSLAVLADPVFTDDDMRVRRNMSKVEDKEKTSPHDLVEIDINSMQMSRSGQETGVTGAEGDFGRLLSTRREAAAILALVPEKERMQALDFEASRATALKPELGEYRIVHFATHGLLNNIHPELSGIVLSLVDEKGRQQDGFLRLQDIYNLKLPSELVVLSACQTGLGKEIKGEGLVGLTRGFMFAGTPRVVASLWKVDDRATSELMKRFYQGMLGPEALRPAGALRQAQLSMWKEKQWRAPYYWAAFVLQGEWK